MVKMHSNDMEDINEALAGDIFALFGLECTSGDTFTADSGYQVRCSSMNVPETVISLGISPKNN